MDTQTLCLGRLHLGDATGYEIKQFFEQAFRHFQKVSFGSIYPALKTLHTEGLIHCDVRSQTGRPDQKRYSLTNIGRSHFSRTLHKTEPTEHFQSDFLTLVLFAQHLSRDRMSLIYIEYLTNLRQERDKLRALLDTESPDKPMPETARFTIEFGIDALNHRITFIETNRQRLLELCPAHQDTKP